ncbi:hypothetical protein IWX92DRAFT_115771 [Phyllosticta citricarpa]
MSISVPGLAWPGYLCLSLLSCCSRPPRGVLVPSILHPTPTDPAHVSLGRRRRLPLDDSWTLHYTRRCIASLRGIRQSRPWILGALGDGRPHHSSRRRPSPSTPTITSAPLTAALPNSDVHPCT